MILGVLQFIISALAGWLIADLVSGIIHWAEDNFGSEDWPIIGPLVIAPNRLHHRDPGAFIRNGTFLSRASTGAAFSLAVGVLVLALTGPSVTLGFAVLGGCLANEVHFWAHRPLAAPQPVRWLQKSGLLQSLDQHAQHHRAPHDRAYCILTNWLNPALDHLTVWPRLNFFIAFLARPH